MVMLFFCLVAFGVAFAAQNGQAAFDKLAELHTCGNCLRAGGAWCLLGDRCVPDGRGMCGSRGGGPADLVGMAGHGKCPSRDDFQLQAYLHAPRRPPLATSSTCSRRCSSPIARFARFANSTSFLEDASAISNSVSQLRECGAVIIQNAVQLESINQLRDDLELWALKHKGKKSNKSARKAYKSRFGKYEVPGVRGTKRHEWVLPFRFAPQLLAALGFDVHNTMNTSRRGIQAPLYHALHAMLSHPPSIEFVSLIAAWPGADAQDWHRDVEAGRWYSQSSSNEYKYENEGNYENEAKLTHKKL